MPEIERSQQCRITKVECYQLDRRDFVTPAPFCFVVLSAMNQ